MQGKNAEKMEKLRTEAEKHFLRPIQQRLSRAYSDVRPAVYAEKLWSVYWGRGLANVLLCEDLRA